MAITVLLQFLADYYIGHQHVHTKRQRSFLSAALFVVKVTLKFPSGGQSV